MESIISGSGGGGHSGAGRTPVDAPDSLRSREFTRIVDVISEGEIGGLVEGLKSVYINGTPLENSDHTKNFTGVSVVERVGTPTQTFVPGFQYAEVETPVATDVLYGTPIVRTITNANVDSARVRVMFPALSKVDQTNGDSLGSSVHLTVEVKPSGGSYANVISDIVSGKSTGKYVRQYAIPLTGSAPWDIRVTRLTADSSSSYEQNSFKFDSYAEIIDVKLRRPNIAAYYVQADSSQFSSVPTRSYKCYGRIIRVPNNYNEITRSYTGIWDGTFKLAYSNNPAWIFMDLVTHPRYGLAKYVPSVNIDKWRLYEIAKYCDGMVDDGFGGLEPRYTVNMHIQSQQQAYSLLNDLASAFECMPSYSGDSLNLIQDSPKDASFVYTPANVIDGKFQYTGSSLSARHSVIRVSYNDPRNHYKRDVVLVIDDELVKKIGYRTLDVIAIGCTSRGQANRKGRRILYTEAVETETVSFSVGLDSLRVEPGQVFKIADPIKTSGSRCGGRLATGSTTSVLQVDQWESPGSSATITVMMPDGTIEKRNVSSVVGQAVTLSSPLSTIPVDGAVWIANGSNATERYWRVLNITEKTGKDRMQFDIVALAYDPDKYAQIDSIGPVVFPEAPRLPRMAKPPSNISFEEGVLIVNDQSVIRIDVSWDIADYAKSYVFKHKVDNGNWSEHQVYTPSYRVEVPSGSILYVAISSVGPMGVPTPSTLAQHDIVGEYTKPVAPIDFELEEEFTGSCVKVKWGALQRIKGYNILIRAGLSHPPEDVLDIGVEPDYTGDTTVLRSIFVGQTHRFEYTSESMILDTAGSPVRDLTIRIQSVGANGLRSDLWSEVTASNPAPGAVTDIVINSFANAFAISCTKPTDRDYKGIAVWMSTSPGFTPGPTNLVFDGDAESILISSDSAGDPVIIDTEYFFRIAAYDAFGKTSLNYGLEISATSIDNGAVVLRASSPIFVVDSAGDALPTDITFRALGAGADLDYVYTTTPSVTLSGTGRIRTLAFDDMTADSVEVEVTNGISSDVTTINKVYNGSAGPAGLNQATVFLYKRTSSSSAPSGPAADVTYTFATGAVSGLSGGWSDTIPSSGGPYCWSVQGIAVGSGPTDILTPGDWSTVALYTQDGAEGLPGDPGLATIVVSLYQWATSTPADPTDNSTWTWSTAVHSAYTGSGSWSTTVPSNPGTPNIKLFEARKPITAPSGTTTTTVDWSGGFSVAQFAQNGANGLQVGEAVVYAWAASIPPGPTGLASFDWATATFGSAPSGYTLTPSSSPTPGHTLWRARVALVDSSAATSTSFNWSSASVAAFGYAGNTGPTGPTGDTGSTGSIGPSGADGLSTRVAYAIISAGTSPGSGTRTSNGINSAPATNSWGLSETWSQSAPTSLGPNQLAIMTVGIYNAATTVITWDSPFVATGKYGSLSAITVNTGALTVNGDMTVTSGAIMGGSFTGASWPASGGGFYLGPSVIRLGRYHGGAGAQWFEVNSSGDLSMPGLAISGGNAVFSGQVSAVTGSFANITLGGLLNTAGKTGYATGNGVMIGNYLGNAYLGITKDLGGGSIQGLWVASTDGVVHMTGADVSGGTVTGSLIRTAASGTRITLNEASSNTLRVYSDSGSGLALSASIGNSVGGYVAFFGNGTVGDSISGVFGQSYSGNGVVGGSSSGKGVWGSSVSGPGVYGGSASGYGVHGYSAGTYGGYFSGATGVYATSTGTGRAIVAANNSTGETVNISNSGSGLALYIPSGGAQIAGDIEGRGVFRLAPSGTSRGVIHYSSGILLLEAYSTVPVRIASNGASVAHFEQGYGTRIEGKFSCNGVTPPARATVSAAVTVVTPTDTLVNELRAALIACGICQ